MLLDCSSAAISVLDESCGSSSSCEDDEDVEFANEDAPDEEAPIYPEYHFTGVSAILTKTFPHGGCASDNSSNNEQTERDSPDSPDTQTA